MKKKKILYSVGAVILASILAFMIIDRATALPKLKDEPLSIITATDLHYISPRINDNGPAFMGLMEKSDGRISQYIEEITDVFVERVIEKKPEVVILSGDISFNGEKESHEDLAAKLSKIKENGTEILLIPGNHDVWNMGSIKFIGEGAEFAKTVTQAEFYEIYKDFGYAKAESRDEETLSYTYPLRDDLKVLMLDVNTDMTENVVLQSTLKWLKKELKKAKFAGEEILLVTHQNILNHSNVISDGYTLLNRDEVLLLLNEYDVKYSLGGHIHIQNIKTEGDFTEIITSALTITPHQYGMISYDGETFDYRTEPISVASWASEQGSTNPELLDFEEFSRQHFMQSEYKKSYERAKELLVSDEDAERMARFYSYINTNYFSGISSDITGYDEEIALWKGLEGRFPRYVQNLVDVSGENNQSYSN